MPETFSSEIGDLHERRGDRPSFTNEFEGASDSLIERERPPRPIDVGRRGRRLMFWLIFSLALVGGGGWALWYWSESIGEWIASWNASDEPEPTVQPQTEPTPVEQPPAEPKPTKVFGVKGAPEDSEPTTPVTPPTIPTDGESLPVVPLDSPPANQPTVKPASVVTASTSVRGKVSSAKIGSKLAVVDTALKGCWTTAAAKPETKRPASLSSSFSIKWNGRLLSSSVTGDAPESVKACVREALPSSGWPQPRDGGEGQVTRTWTLE